MKIRVECRNFALFVVRIGERSAQCPFAIQQFVIDREYGVCYGQIRRCRVVASFSTDPDQTGGRSAPEVAATTGRAENPGPILAFPERGEPTPMSCPERVKRFRRGYR